MAKTKDPAKGRSMEEKTTGGGRAAKTSAKPKAIAKTKPKARGAGGGRRAA